MSYSAVLSENMEKFKANLEVTLQWFEKNHKILQPSRVKIKQDNKDNILKEFKNIQAGLAQAISAMKAIELLCEINIEKDNKERR